MKKFDKKLFEPLDSEEKELMESLEREEWRPVDDLNQEKLFILLPLMYLMRSNIQNLLMLKWLL